jgi:hypothetical protein
MLMAAAARYRRYRAPQADGQTLVEPPRSALADVVAQNRRHLSELDYDLQGRSLADLMASARSSLVAAAVDYTRHYREVNPRHLAAAKSGGAIILSGHQPQLFHAGVWYKNFVLGDLAAEVGGAAIHLLIDSDLCRTASIRVPTGSIEHPRVDTVPFDAPAAEVPFEERAIADEAVFRSFAERVSERLRPLVSHPIVESLWQHTLERGNERNLGLRLAQGRHRLEAAMGNDTLELRQSSVCQLPEFHWFVAHLVAHLPRFWAAHNDSLAAYRVAHRLRNRAHPVPDLAQSDGYLEAPFWMWTAKDPRRHPVFARQQGEQLELTDRRGSTITLTLSADTNAALASEELAAAANRGIKLRTRALATTLFARLLASDLFIHGIGGAKYDQVTDDIARRFFGFDLPEFAAASATLRLPIAHAAPREDELRRIRHELRELDYHPERFVSSNGDASIASAVSEKSRWLAATKTTANAHARHQAIVAANATLQPFVAMQREDLQRERERLESRLAVASIIDSREYSFCLFPREHFERLLGG